MIRTPTQCIGDSQPINPLRHLPVGANTQHYSVIASGFAKFAIRLNIVAHGTYPEITERVGATIVEANIRIPFQSEAVIASLVCTGPPPDQLLGHRDEQTPRLGTESKRDNRLIEKPMLQSPTWYMQTVDQKPVDIAPVKGLFLSAPSGSFTNPILYRAETPYLL